MSNESSFWQNKTLSEMSSSEWDSLCDGCAKCCLHKIEDEDNGDIFYTNVEKVKLAVETIYEQLRAFNQDFIDTGDSFRKSSNKLRLAYGKYSRIFPSVKTIAENLKNTEIEITDEHDFMEDKTREKNLQDEDIQKLKSKLKEEEKPDNN